MKTIFLNCALLLSLYLPAQSKLSPILPRATAVNAMPDKSATVPPAAPERKFADYFMKKATVIDASGNIIIGRSNIISWHDRQVEIGQSAVHACKIIESVVRQIRPDLAVVLAKTIGSDSNASYNILWRRIDGKWYIETCTIVADGNRSGTPIVCLQPDLLNLAER